MARVVNHPVVARMSAVKPLPLGPAFVIGLVIGILVAALLIPVVVIAVVILPLGVLALIIFRRIVSHRRFRGDNTLAIFVGHGFLDRLMLCGLIRRSLCLSGNHW